MGDEFLLVDVNIEGVSTVKLKPQGVSFSCPPACTSVRYPYNSLASLVHIRDVLLRNEEHFVDLFPNPVIISNSIDSGTGAADTEDVIPIV